LQWKLVSSVLAAYALWFFTFRISFSSFWLRLAFSVSVLLIISVWMRGKELLQDFRKIRPTSMLGGALVGLALYLLLLAGYALLEPYVASSAGEVYLFRSEGELSLIALLLVFTSIGEEAYWRGYLLQSLRGTLKTRYALTTASLIYSSVHVWTMNMPLMLIAFIAGMVWGSLYVRTDSLTSAAISHIVWTELIFVFAPLQ